MKGLIAILAAAAAATAAAQGSSWVGWNTVAPSKFVLVNRGKYNGSMYAMEIPGGKYNTSAPPMMIDLYGTSYEQGYDFGVLTGKAAVTNMDSLFAKILGGSGPVQDILKLGLNAFLDWQWKEYLSVAVAQQAPWMLEEVQGFTAGASTLGVKDGGSALTRGTTLANFPGSIKDLAYVLADEFGIPVSSAARHVASAGHEAAWQAVRAAVVEAMDAHPVGVTIAGHLASAGLPTTSPGEWLLAQAWPGMHCSMMAFWGSRTADARLFSGRNLDWLSDSGINAHKYVVNWRPVGGIAHAVVGFAGLQGALTGMSAAGLTVHEANLEEKQETFRGFPWMLRLRAIMASAENLAEAKAMWGETANTVGFNHMIASAKDGSAWVMETEANYTAYFQDDDPREAAATYSTPSGPVQAGYPLPEAVWRTNHGYDPKIRGDFLWSQGPNTDSQHRYDIIHDQIVAYAEAGTPIGPLQAINITSLPGDKGDDFYFCGDTHKGANVLSVTYDPARGTMYAAWEAFSGASWRPAACGTYVELDMGRWLAGQGGE